MSTNHFLPKNIFPDSIKNSLSTRTPSIPETYCFRVALGWGPRVALGVTETPVSRHQLRRRWWAEEMVRKRLLL